LELLEKGLIYEYRSVRNRDSYFHCRSSADGSAQIATVNYGLVLQTSIMELTKQTRRLLFWFWVLIVAVAAWFWPGFSGIHIVPH